MCIHVLCKLLYNSNLYLRPSQLQMPFVSLFDDCLDSESDSVSDLKDCELDDLLGLDRVVCDSESDRLTLVCVSGFDGVVVLESMLDLQTLVCLSGFGRDSDFLKLVVCVTILGGVSRLLVVPVFISSGDCLCPGPFLRGVVSCGLVLVCGVFSFEEKEEEEEEEEEKEEEKRDTPLLDRGESSSSQSQGSHRQVSGFLSSSSSHSTGGHSH